MKSKIESVPIDKLVGHPENPNRMSKVTFAKLVRNIERTGRYEPLTVRKKSGSFQIINGHNRLAALKQLGFENVDVVVWDVDDTQARILLGSLNRLCGSDVLDKKLTLLGKLEKKVQAGGLSKLLPQTARQIERLTRLGDKRREGLKRALKKATEAERTNPDGPINPRVFFLSDEQKRLLEKAMSLACGSSNKKTKAAANAAAITQIAENFINGKNNDDSVAAVCDTCFGARV